MLATKAVPLYMRVSCIAQLGQKDDAGSQLPTFVNVFQKMVFHDGNPIVDICRSKRRRSSLVLSLCRHARAS